MRLSWTGLLLLGSAGSAAYAQPYAYVSNQMGNNVSIVDLGTNTVSSTIFFSSGGLAGLAVTPAGSLFVTAQSLNVVAVMNTVTKSVVATIPVGSQPTHVAITPSGATAYVVNQGSNNVSVIDTATNSVTATIPVGAAPAGIAITPNGSMAIVPNSNSGGISVISTSTDTVVATWAGLSGASGIAISADGTLAFVVNQSNNSLTIYEISTGGMLFTVSGLSSPSSVALSPNGPYAYVTNGNTSSVAVINTSTGQIVSSVGVGALPTAAAVSADGSTVYVTNGLGFSLSEINTSTNTVTSTISGVGIFPYAIVLPGASPSSIAISAGNGQSVNVGQPFPTPLLVNVTNANGAPVAGIPVTFAVQAGAGGASATFSSTPSMPIMTDANGNAAAPLLTAGNMAGSFNVAASANTLTASFSLTNLSSGSPIGPGTATHFSVTAPASTSAGLPIQFTVAALDANNNVFPGYADPVHFTSTDPAAALPGNATLSNGVGTFQASLITPGNTTITASDPLSPAISGTSESIAVSAPAGGLRFVPMPPCRVADTRDVTKPSGFGPPALGAGTSRSFAIPSGPCTGIPATAQAYALNVTVVPQGYLNYLTVWPTGQNLPVPSTLNSWDGEVKANAAIVAGGVGAAISVFTTDNTDVVLDINGYFVPNTDAAALGFYPMTPCRMVDTRAGAPSTVVSGTLAAGSTTTLPLLASSCNVPSTAQAYSLNVTLVPPGPVGYLTVWPTGQDQPDVSTLNDPTGTVEANAAIAPAGTGGGIDVYVTDTTDLLVDINGYFAPEDSGALSLYALPPCRVLDSRTPAGAPAFVGAMNVDVLASGCGGTSAAEAYVFNATVVPESFLGYLTLWPQGSPQPLVSTLNAYNGEVTSNMAIVLTGNSSISAFADDSTYLILDLFGYFAP